MLLASVALVLALIFLGLQCCSPPSFWCSPRYFWGLDIVCFRRFDGASFDIFWSCDAARLRHFDGARFDICWGLDAARSRGFGARFDIFGVEMLLASVILVLALTFVGFQTLLFSTMVFGQ
jgi:hypothetical protein